MPLSRSRLSYALTCMLLAGSAAQPAAAQTAPAQTAPAPTAPAPTAPTPTAPPRTAPTDARRPAGQPAPNTARPVTSGMALPTDYLIGPDDVLGVLFWRDTEMSGDVTVRPDGHITLPLVRDVKAAGLTPDQLREVITKAAGQYIEDPNVTVVVRQINSRNVFITGQVARPGSYPVTGQMTVLQLIALCGGLNEFANGKKISVARPGMTTVFRFNYSDVLNGKKLEQNIVLKPGDTVLVP